MFSKEGIKGVVFDRNGDKSSGPESFNLEFMKKCWDIVGKKVIGVVQEFHKRGRLPKCVASYFLALIPKCEIPQSLEEYRPICQISALLKII